MAAGTEALFLYTTILVVGLAVCINVTSLSAPPWVEAGGEASLDCRYRLEGETLYSIKWYQGLSEIYRFTPSKRQPVQVFPNHYLTVDVGRSAAGRMHVSNVSVGADGPFRCEVSGEAPAFFTGYGVVQLRVIALPREGPVLLGVPARVSPGDWITLTCVVSIARPAPKLTFTINGNKPRASWVGPQETLPLPGGVFSSTLRMRFYFREELLHGPYQDEARVRCEARIPGLYEGATEESLSTRAPRPQVPVLEGRTAGAAGGLSGCWSVALTALLVAMVSTVLHQICVR